MICDRIRQIREQNAMTQAALAKRLGISRSSVNAWEMGITVPSTQYIVEMATLFSISSDYLLELDDNITLNITRLDTDEKELLFRLMKYFQGERQSDDASETTQDDI